MVINKAYENLANAIILLAVEDIREENVHAYDARCFLKSSWFEVLSTADGNEILKRLDKEIEAKHRLRRKAVI